MDDLICQNIDPTLYARTGGLVDEFESVFQGRVWYRYYTTLHTVYKLQYYTVVDRWMIRYART